MFDGEGDPVSVQTCKVRLGIPTVDWTPPKSLGGPNRGLLPHDVIREAEVIGKWNVYDQMLAMVGRSGARAPGLRHPRSQREYGRELCQMPVAHHGCHFDGDLHDAMTVDARSIVLGIRIQCQHATPGEVMRGRSL